MNRIKRLYVEKRWDSSPPHNIKARDALADIKENLGINGISELRILNRYDIEGLTAEEFELCKNTVFSEPPVDIVYENCFPQNEDDFVFSVKYLPGQYDQRADSAVFCCQMVCSGSFSDDAENKREILVECAKVYICSGNFSCNDRDKIKRYFINTVDEMEASLDIPQSLKMNLPKPAPVKFLDGFINKTEKEISEITSEMNLAMNLDDMLILQEYFKNEEKRNPTVTEIRMIDTYWSDHCRHTTFLTEIQNIRTDEGFYKELIDKAFELYLNERKFVYESSEKPICLMDIATLGMKTHKKRGLLQDLDESEEINACSIVVKAVVNGKEEEWLVMFKNETHNHPTEIEPYGGAATCLGGAIRDPLSGRSFVYQAMRVTGSGDPRRSVDETLPGKLPQSKITKGAASGFSSYGNQIGLATGLVSEIYHDGYTAKRMEIGAVIGAVKKENVVRSTPEKGDVVILVGGRTGRDGIGGATGSSKEHTGESMLKCGSEVQKGNPPTERMLQRLFRKPCVSVMVKKCNDFGAGGVSVAIGELADSIEINLDSILKKYDGLDGTELAISESQERMAVVVAAKDTNEFIRQAELENLEAVAVAKVTEDNRLVMKWQGDKIVDISRDFLNKNGARHFIDAFIKMPEKACPIDDTSDMDIKSKWLKNLQNLNVAAQKGLSERFDSVIGAGTVLMPYGGKHQLTPIQAMVAKLPVEGGDVDTSTIMSYGFNPYLSEWSPFHGAVSAVVESLSKIVAVGGSLDKTRLSFQEYFGKPGGNAYRFGIPFSALLGAFYAQTYLKTPSIGGKDSMSGSFKDLDVPPTLVSFAVSHEKTKFIISPEFKKSGNLIVILKTEYGKDDLPVFEKFLRNAAIVEKYIKEKKIVSAYANSIGGIAAALSKMAFGNGHGFKLSSKNGLFTEEVGTFILEIEGTSDLVKEWFDSYNFEIIGQVIPEEKFILPDFEIDLKDALNTWLEPLESTFPTWLLKEKKETQVKPALYRDGEVQKAPTVKRFKPKTLIPVFPGTNSEYDTKACFDRAGADTDIFVVRNLTLPMLAESVKELAKRIDNSDIIALPGGFSAGDEPDGSGKYIAAIFRHPLVSESVMNLLKKRDGLMLGICNGFQALIKLGLLPYGEIREADENSPTLTFNEIGRHVSLITRTMVTSNLSPWLSKSKPGDIHSMPVSHGEGRFAASEKDISLLIERGQIATQYVDFSNNASMDIKFNPNGSTHAIEGLTSPDGRVLGKMGHSERISDGIYKNIHGNFDQKLFESAVYYFTC